MSPARPGPVLVTGANSGIGLATLLDLARRGWETWGSVRSEAKAADVAEAAAEARVGERVRTVVLDVADHDAVVERWPEMPPFYAVVNNAGMSEMGAIEDVSAAEAKALLDVNLIAPAIVVAGVIVSAIETPRPLRRYVVGADAIALVTASRLVPRAFLDVSARLMTGLRNTPERRS
jgi:NAD(P)-dependent dehydrogenase (short-subunit alcohol dehydrogenase family)